MKLLQVGLAITAIVVGLVAVFSGNIGSLSVAQEAGFAAACAGGSALLCAISVA